MPDPAAGRREGRQARPRRNAAADRQDEDALELLANGRLTVTGRLIEASNATLYGTMEYEGTEAACVYKPVAGERPLWDFSHGSLAGREVSAYLVSRASGWDIVPPTVYRDGPAGPGMCQLWIDPDPSVDLLSLARRTDHPGLKNMALLDAVINNADRKIGHLLPAPDGHLYGCDHGVSFAEDYKLRTVLWQWRGERLGTAAVTALECILLSLESGELAASLPRWLSKGEVTATRLRIKALLEHRVFPFPPEDWPAIPWPPI